MGVGRVSKERDEYSLMWEQAGEADEDWPTSAKKVLKEMCGLLERAHDETIQLTKDYGKQLVVEKGLSNCLEAQATVLTRQV